MKISWDYYSQYMEKQKMFQTTNQILNISQYDGNRWNMFWNMMEYDFTLLDIAMFHIVV